VGLRSDLELAWSFPRSTHSRISLLRSQYVTGEYLEKHKIKRNELPPISATTLKNLKSDKILHKKPWLTIRDAISDLSDPANDNLINNHFFIPGARTYRGHTGSPYDTPSKTLKAGVHGVPGGENTLQLKDGRVRYFTVRECARLQCFPDEYYFKGSWTSAIRGIGNSVPVIIAQTFAESLYATLIKGNSIRSYKSLKGKGSAPEE